MTRYSLDVFVADLLHLTTDDARHVLQKLAAPLGSLGASRARGRRGLERMRPPQTFSAALNEFVRKLSSRSEVARLRAEAARVDAEFARQEAAASANLVAIRQRNAIDSSKRLLARTAPASSPCRPCVADPFKRRP